MVSCPWVRIKSTDYFCYCKVLVFWFFFLQAFTFRCSLIRKKPDWKRMDVKPKSTNPLVCQLLSTIYFVLTDGQYFYILFMFLLNSYFCTGAARCHCEHLWALGCWSAAHSFHTTVEIMWSIDLKGKWADSDIELFYPQSTLYNRPHSHPLKQTLFNTGIACLYCLTSLLLK